MPYKYKSKSLAEKSKNYKKNFILLFVLKSDRVWVMNWNSNFGAISIKLVNQQSKSCVHIDGAFTLLYLSYFLYFFFSHLSHSDPHSFPLTTSISQQRLLQLRAECKDRTRSLIGNLIVGMEPTTKTIFDNILN